MAKINEKTLEINICTEIMYTRWKWFRIRVLFLGPSLQDEAKVGYDVKGFAQRMTPFYIQYKRGEKDSTGTVAKYKINGDTHNKQHHLLVNLSKRNVVFYGLPLLFSIQDLMQSKWQLLRRTKWISLKGMKPLPAPPNKEHEIRINLVSGTYNVHSSENQEYEESENWESVEDALGRDANLLTGEEVYENNIWAVRETFGIETIPKDAGEGLVFGALLES